MISTDFPQFYKPIYYQNTTPAQEGAKDSVSPVGKNGQTDEPANAAAPLTGFGSLLSAKDIHMLMVRKISMEDRAAYKDMLSRFKSNPKYQTNPQEFLKTLSPEGVRLLERVQSFPPDANVKVGELNNEEALNFILPHTQKVDLNNDGMIAGPNGAKSFQFPPPNAPQSVKDAWNDATANMSERDTMLLSGQFMTMMTAANINVDDTGNVTITEPGTPNWKNPFADPAFSYREAVAALQDGNEAGKPYNSNESYERMKALLTMIDDGFSRHGVA